MEAPVKSASTTSVAIKMGLLYGAFCILTFILFARFGSPTQSALSSLVSWASAVGIVVLAHMTYKKAGDGFMSFGQGVGIAVITGLIAAVLVGIGVYVYLKLDPTMIENIREAVDKEMDKKGADSEGAEVAGKIVDLGHDSRGHGIFASLGVFFKCLIFGLIVSIFTKKESAPAPY